MRRREQDDLRLRVYRRRRMCDCECLLRWCDGRAPEMSSEILHLQS